MALTGVPALWLTTIVGVDGDATKVPCHVRKSMRTSAIINKRDSALGYLS